MEGFGIALDLLSGTVRVLATLFRIPTWAWVPTTEGVTKTNLSLLIISKLVTCVKNVLRV
jgi:hypothetical protein